MDLITVVVPVYNVEQYLKDCIDSIILQTYKDIEIILVDDGSTDTSGLICDEYKSKDKRIKVFHKENGGLSSARNCGIENATGKYITFVDSDDVVRENYILFLYKAITELDCDFSWCAFNYFKNGKLRYEEIKDYSAKLLVKNEFYNKEMFEKGGVNSTAKLFKTEIVKKIKFSNGKYHEDVFFYNELIKNKQYKIGSITNDLYIYKIRSTSICKTQMNDKRHIDLINATLELFDLVFENDFNRDLGLYCLSTLNGLLFHREWINKDKKFLRKIIKFYGKNTIKYEKSIKKKTKYFLSGIFPSLYLPLIKEVK